MAGFFDRMLGRDNSNKGSSSKAKDRLQFVLLHERINIPPEKMREMKAEIMDVIAKYVPEIDRESVEVQVEQSDRYQNKLVAEIPFSKRAPAPARETDDTGTTPADEMNTADATMDAEPSDADGLNDSDNSDDDTIPNLHEQETRKHVPVQDDTDDDTDTIEKED
jgi:cell division topological specificity factor